MIRVKVDINYLSIASLVGVNIYQEHGLTYGTGRQIYEITDSDKNYWLLEHVFEDGAESLAAKMLLSIKDKAIRYVPSDETETNPSG